MLVFLAFKKNIVIMRGVWQRSSVVEQRNHNLWSGVRIPPLLPKIQPRFVRGLIFGIVVDDEDPRGRQKSRFCKWNAAKPLRFGKGPAHKVCGNTQSLRCYQNSNRPCGGCFVFYLYYDLGPVVKPRDDKGHRKHRPNGRWGLSCVLLFFVKCRQDFCGIMMHMLLDGTEWCFFSNLNPATGVFFKLFGFWIVWNKRAVKYCC